MDDIYTINRYYKSNNYNEYERFTKYVEEIANSYNKDSFMECNLASSLISAYLK
jgi:hypothetical protein